MENQVFNRYKDIKTKLNINYRGISLNNVLAIYMYGWANKVDTGLHCLKGFFRYANLNVFQSLKKEKILFSDVNRKDHINTFLEICKRLDKEWYVINHPEAFINNTCIRISNIYRALRVTLGVSIPYTYWQKICMAGNICFFFNTIDYLYRLKINKCTKFVVYSSVHPYQNLLMQFYRQNGTDVMGLSHGSQFVFKKNIPVDCLNYENLICKCVTWSQMTKDEYVKYGLNPNDIYVGGYPKHVDLKKVKKNNKMKRCLVLACRYLFDESNFRLLDLLSNQNLEVYIKLHPTCNIEKYAEFCNKFDNMHLIQQKVLLEECMDNEKYDFAIAINTTSYYEIMIAGIPCLRYDDGDSYDLTRGNENDRFSNIEEFNSSINWVKEKVEKNKYDDERKRILTYCIGYGIDNYKKILG